jgi:3-deoxy-7-phosphoheptulonate synthase
MIIQLENNIAAQQKEQIIQAIEALNYKVNQVKTQHQEYLVAIGKVDFDIRSLGALPGIKDIHRVSDDYKLVSRKWRVEETCIDLGDGVKIGKGHFALMAGPCSIENEKQIEQTVAHLVKNNVRIMRGGVYKPRSSPYSFRGLGLEGLKLFYQICRENGIKIITEVMQESQIEGMYEYVDVFQVGARNAQNFNLLDALGEVDKPVLLKRGMSGTLNELLQGAEYIFSNGNEKIMLCERGIRTYENAYRNTLDLNAVPILKEKSHLPVIVDPSHGIGIRKFVEPMALAGIMAGCDGLIVEVHQCPQEAYSDGQQTLDFQEAEVFYEKARKTLTLRNSFEMT